MSRSTAPGLFTTVVELVVGAEREPALRLGAGPRREVVDLRHPARARRPRRQARLGRARLRRRPTARSSRTRMLAGEGAEGKVTGAYALTGRQHLDFDTTQEHAAPHCVSDLAFRGILGGRSSARLARDDQGRPRARRRPTPSRSRATCCCPRRPTPTRSRASRSSPTTSAAPTRRRSPRSTPSSSSTCAPAACRSRSRRAWSSRASSPSSSSASRRARRARRSRGRWSGGSVRCLGEHRRIRHTQRQDRERRADRLVVRSSARRRRPAAAPGRPLDALPAC